MKKHSTSDEDKLFVAGVTTTTSIKDSASLAKSEFVSSTSSSLYNNSETDSKVDDASKDKKKHKRSFLKGLVSGSSKSKDKNHDKLKMDQIEENQQENEGDSPPKQKKKKRGILKRLFGKSKQPNGKMVTMTVDRHGTVIATEEQALEFEPEMTLTQMVDLLTGKDNKLSKHL